MYVKQLSVFIENREGRLEEVLSTLKEEQINIVSLSLADTSDYGMLRLVVSDPLKGKDALRKKGFSATLTDIIALKMEHRVGTLQHVLSVVCGAGINIEYMYALSTGTDEAAIAIKPSDLEKAEEVLKGAGVQFFTAEEMAHID